MFREYDQSAEMTREAQSIFYGDILVLFVHTFCSDSHSVIKNPFVKASGPIQRKFILRIIYEEKTDRLSFKHSQGYMNLGGKLG